MDAALDSTASSKSKEAPGKRICMPGWLFLRMRNGSNAAVHGIFVTHEPQARQPIQHGYIQIASSSVERHAKVPAPTELHDGHCLHEADVHYGAGRP